MSQALALTLWALLALELKHFLCDFVLQSEYQVRTRLYEPPEIETRIAAAQWTAAATPSGPSNVEDR